MKLRVVLLSILLLSITAVYGFRYLFTCRQYSDAKVLKNNIEITGCEVCNWRSDTIIISKPDSSIYVVYLNKKLVAGTNVGGTFIQLPFVNLIVKRPQGVVFGDGKNELLPNLSVTDKSIQFNADGDTISVLLDGE